MFQSTLPARGATARLQLTEPTGFSTIIPRTKQSSDKKCQASKQNSTHLITNISHESTAIPFAIS